MEEYQSQPMIYTTSKPPKIIIKVNKISSILMLRTTTTYGWCQKGEPAVTNTNCKKKKDMQLVVYKALPYSY